MGIYSLEKREQLVSISSAPNETFDDFAERMAEVAREKSTLVVGYFYSARSGFVELRCSPETEPNDIIEAYYAKFQEGGLYPEVTPKTQARANKIFLNLQFLDFSNMEDVLMWFHGFSAVTTIKGLEYDPQNVLAVFKGHGYEPDMDFPGKDPKNRAKRIIVSCLKELRDKGKIDVRMANTYIGRWLRWERAN